MNKSKTQKLQITFIISYFILNIINTYFLTTNLLNRYISPFKHSFTGEINAVVGNFAMLLFALLIINLIFKKAKSKMLALTLITLFLNILIFALGFFTLFYGTAFASNALDIFKNPAGGIAHGMFGVVMGEIFLYYRILIFIPFTFLLVIFIKYNKALKINSSELINFNLNIKNQLSLFFTFILLISLSAGTYTYKFRNSELPIGSTMSTHAVQNLGAYPFYASNLLGVDFDVTSRKSLGLNTELDLYEAYNKFNKNQNSYTNIIDGNAYSNITKYNKSDDLYIKDLNDQDPINGIFKDKNIILVHMESLNYFLFELEETKARMPFIQSLLEESYVFDNYFTSVGMGVSADAEASVLTGLYMNGHSTLYWDANKHAYDFDTIPKLLAKQDYKSVGTHNDYKTFYNREIAYPNLIGFTEEYHSLENYAQDNNMTTKDYVDYLMKIGFEGHKSPWPSDLQLSDYTYNTSNSYKSNNQKHMIFDVTMMPHTPFEFDPYADRVRPEYNKWDKKLGTLTRNYINYVDYIDDVVKRLFVGPNGEDRIIEDNVYIFYGDHGSSLKNGDLSVLFDRQLDLMEERSKLQQVAAFIYAPGSTKRDINGYNINEGLITGNQPLVRGHVDMYRTIVDLFDLFDETNFYLGVNGLSDEPTYVIDNRIQDLVVDNKDKLDSYIVSLRNNNNKFPRDTVIDQVLLTDIRYFKQLSDLLLTDAEIYKDVKKALQR